MLPRYGNVTLLEGIGRGGMGAVFVGRDETTGELVAVKRLHAHLAGDRRSRRGFLREGNVIAKVRHPNVVALRDTLELRSDLLLVMEFVEGASLDILLRRAQAAGRPVPTAVAVRIVLDAAAGLYAAHVLKDDDGRPLSVVHRDVSPHNLLVGRDGVAKVTDFGLARAEDALTGSMATENIRGKLGYLSPEHLSHAKLDARADQFALGVIFWEILAGRPLFRRGADADTIRAVLEADIPALVNISPELGDAFDAILSHALSRDPETRFRDLDAFSVALETHAHAAGIVATRADVAAFVEDYVGADLAERRARIAAGTASAEPVKLPPSRQARQEETPTLSRSRRTRR